MNNKIIYLIVALVIIITFIGYTRYEFHTYNVEDENQCLVKSNIYTGNSCIVAGESICRSRYTAYKGAQGFNEGYSNDYKLKFCKGSYHERKKIKDKIY
mgnify:FL=1